MPLIVSHPESKSSLSFEKIVDNILQIVAAESRQEAQNVRLIYPDEMTVHL